MRTYCVTGGAGFIGSHVCRRLLEQGHRVINLDNFSEFYDYKLKISNVLYSTGLAEDGSYTDKQQDLARLRSLVNDERYRLCLLDIRNIAELDAVFQSEQIDGVIHLAAMAGVRPSIENPLLYEEVNIRGTLNVLETMRKYDVRKWIFASSSSVYGNHGRSVCSEKDAVDEAVSPYAFTKKACEEMGYTYQHLYGIDAVMLRLFTVYGPRQRPDLAINKFIGLMDSGKEIPFYGDGDSTRDYTYIDDTVSGLLSALEYIENHEHVFEIVNLGTGQTISLQTLVSTIEEGLGKQANLRKMLMQDGDVQHTRADISKASLLFDYFPRVNFTEGVCRAIQWRRGVCL